MAAVCAPYRVQRPTGGFYVAAGYDAVVEIARNPDIFSTVPDEANRSVVGIPFRSPWPYPKSPLELDGTEFRAVRRLLEAMMSRGAVAEMAPGIKYFTDYFLDQVIESGKMELVRDFTAPVTASISIDWFGLAPQDWWEFFARRFSDAQKTKPGTPEYDAAMHGLAEVQEVMTRATVERRERPRDDATSKIANAELNGEPISERLAIGTAAFVLMGGINTTAISTAHALIYLSENRDCHQRLREDDKFLRSAFEELLRLSTATLTTARRVTCPVTLGGQELEPGDGVMVGWVYANRDPAVFPEPDEADLDRWPNKHVAFGAGIHRCVGAKLAEAMSKQMLLTVLERIPDFRVVDVEISPYRAIDHGFARVQVEFAKGARVLPAGPPTAQFHTPTD